VLELVDADGSVADTVRFEVRGALARTPAKNTSKSSPSSIAQQRP
jgi:hypothetical protein